MLEVRKSTFTKNYENSFFREFSRHLHKSFKEKNLTGVLIGSPVCVTDERLQIDALLITTNVICIIDFKNFGGKIILPDENNFAKGLWKNEAGDQIKGGSSINPFLQLKIQKGRFIDVFNWHIQKHIKHPNMFNPLHLVRIVCFQEEVELIGKIPSSDSLNFLILDKTNFLEKIFDIIDVTDKEVQLNEEAIDSFKNVFRANKYTFDENPYEDKLRDIAAKSTKHDYSTLYEDQKSALSEIKLFLEDPDQRIFILQGTTNSGKSHIIPFIQEIAYDTGIQETEIFAATGKVAHNLLSQSNLESVHSIYSYIYGGTIIEGEEDESLADEEPPLESEIQEESEKIPVEIIPLKKCDNTEDALFIVDESQLVSNTYYESIDLRFGSGFLLRDYLEFTSILKTKRKIIFVGDPFQLHSGKTENSSLNPKLYEEIYSIKAAYFPLLDKPDYSELTNQALECVRGIRASYFNSFKFAPGRSLSFLKKEETLPYIQDLMNQAIDFHYLCFKNEDSQKINYWIKKTILNNGEEITKGDLVLINNNIQIEDPSDPFSEPKKIFNGEFAEVVSVSSDIRIETKIIEKEVTSLKFREIILKLTEYSEPVKILSLENFRLNSKPELSKNEIVLFKLLLNDEIIKAKNKNPFINSPEFIALSQEKLYKEFDKSNSKLVDQFIKGTSRRKDLSEEELKLRKLINSGKKKFVNKIRASFSKDSTSEYYKLRNAAHLRFGWAMTVHKSTSFKWQEVIFNVSQNDNSGRTNADYFSWIYTGITRARNKVNLINYEPISPFDKTHFFDNNGNLKPSDILFISPKSDHEERLSDLREFVDSKLLLSHIVIENINHLNYQERIIISKDKLKADISIGYDGQGKFKSPKFINGDKEFGNKAIELIKKKSKTFDFSVIKEKWRKTEYENLAKYLNAENIYFESLIQTNFKDKIRFFENENELDIEVDYTGNGAFSKITAKYYSKVDIWEKFIKVVENLKS